jgi:hypothetical protein
MKPGGKQSERKQGVMLTHKVSWKKVIGERKEKEREEKKAACVHAVSTRKVCEA